MAKLTISHGHEYRTCKLDLRVGLTFSAIGLGRVLALQVGTLKVLLLWFVKGR